MVPFLVQLLGLVSLAAQAGEDIIPLVQHGINVANSNADPTAQDWERLHETERRLTGIVDHAALEANAAPVATPPAEESAS